MGLESCRLGDFYFEGFKWRVVLEVWIDLLFWVGEFMGGKVCIYDEVNDGGFRIFLIYLDWIRLDWGRVRVV